MPAKPFQFNFASFLGRLTVMVVGAILARVGSYLFTEYIRPNPIFINIQVFDDSATRKPGKVCWQFRMHGSSEQTGGIFNHGNTGIRFSTGVPSVPWKKQT